MLSRLGRMKVLPRTVRGKLTSVVFLTTAIALLVAGFFLLRHDLQTFRQSWATDLTAQADILALSTAPALAFDDHKTAERNLAALRARPEVLSAALYDARGQLYAYYAKTSVSQPPAQLPVRQTGAHISGETVDVTERIVQNNEMLGTIYLRARFDIASRVRAYIDILATVMLLSMAVALALSAALRRVITNPLDAMANVARQIVTRRDYSLRAQKTTEDEIGLVVDAFNSMLDEVQSRTRALEQKNVDLQKSQRLYRAIGESIAYGVWICDADGRNIYVSDSFLRLVGLTQEQCSSFGWKEVLHPDEAEATIAAWQECVRTGNKWYREHRFRGVDGRYHTLLAQGVPLRDDQGVITGWAGINLDIGRLKQTEEALREADRRKDEFLATLAHELRNPLAPIRHAAKLLESPALEAGQRHWAHEVIGRQVQRMALLLDDLLDVSRITRGRLELRKDYVELTALVNSAIETARPLIDAKHHRLDIQLPREPLELEVDPLRISQALSNLLTNAAKYTDEGGQITLTAQVTAADVRMSVTDTGIGLTPSAIPKLFEMFSQIDSVIDRAEGGLGIGLALVKGLAALHGGSVEAASAGLGKGSTFTIRLPHSVIVTRKPPHLSGESVKQGSQDASGTGVRATILVADDNQDAANSLALVLKFEGFDVHVAHSGAQALAIGAREKPDAAILDIGMPEMNGYELARRIRQQAWGRRALLIALTGWGQEDDKERATAAGFDRHLTKPADPDRVAQLIRNFLSRQSGRTSPTAPVS